MSRLGPCPQAARAPGRGPVVNDPFYFSIEATPIIPRPGDPPPSPFPVRIEPAIVWPYHLPRFNGIDCLWWSMLCRAAYWTDSTWVRRVAEWAQPVLRIAFQRGQDPGIQGYALVEFSDSWLCIAPGTTNDTEFLSYVLSHTMDELTIDQVAAWYMNSTFALRGQSIWLAAQAWPYPTAKPLVAMGHSAGGAFAGYVGFKHVAAVPDSSETVVTFGAPRWSNDSLATYANPRKRPQVIEFVNPNDPVPSVPPDWSIMDLFTFPYALQPRPRFSHLGNLLTLGGRGRPPGAPEATTRDAAVNAVRQILTGADPIFSHRLRTYTYNAQLWGDNDQSLIDFDWGTEYDKLVAILVAMNAVFP